MHKYLATIAQKSLILFAIAWSLQGWTAPLEITSTKRFQKFVDANKDKTTVAKEFETVEDAEKRFSGVGFETFRIKIEPDNPYGTSKPYPSYFNYSPEREVARVAISGGRINYSIFDFTRKVTGHDFLYSQYLIHVSKKSNYVGQNAFGARAQVKHEELSVYHIAYDPSDMPSEGDMEFPLTVDQARKELKDMHIVIEFHPKMWSFRHFCGSVVRFRAWSARRTCDGQRGVVPAIAWADGALEGGASRIGYGEEAC